MSHVRYRLELMQHGGRRGDTIAVMRAIVYRQTGDPDVLTLVERPEPRPRSGEVLVRVAVSGVNPTDWKWRRGDGPGQPLDFPEVVPNQDGAGSIEAVGEGVDPARVGERVWLWEAARNRANGTAQELLTIPSNQVVALPEGAPFDLGASIPIPTMTAHRCLTVGVDGPAALGPDALARRTVLVAGGAGAVGHAAVELAVWSGATVITTVSTPEKAALALAAGAHHVVNYRERGADKAIRDVAPDRVDLIVEVAPVANAVLNTAVVAPNGTVAMYECETDALTIDADAAFPANTRYQFVLTYTVPRTAKEQAIRDITDALAAGALRVGDEAGLPLHRFPLERTADAHAAVENNAVGKVLIDIDRAS
jgi:NADPH:quinone reductase